MDKLRAFLDEEGLTQQAFAELIGRQQATVSRLLNRTALPSLSLAVRIEQVTSGRVPVSSWTTSMPGQPEGDAA